jgi:ABC-2 type transport system permease protein
MMAYCLSGLILPLPLFPDRLRPLVEWLPFSGLVDRPIRLYLGHIPWQEAGWVLGHQFVWCALLVLLGRGLLQRAVRHLEINGG